MLRPHRLPRPTVLLALAAGLVAGACGGTLYDAEGVPRIDPNGCLDGTHACPGSLGCVPQDATRCGDACGSCTGAPQSGRDECVKDGGGAYVCGFSCLGATRVCGGACLPQSATACGTGCTDCTATGPIANGAHSCVDQGAGFACGFTCAAGYFKTATGCQPPAAIAAGARHACALTSGGAVSCWGANEAGQLGAAPGPGGVDEVLALQAGQALVPVTAAPTVAGGGQHTCAITASGGVTCWGSNASGQLGAAGGPGRVTVTLVGAGATAVTLAAGASHTCALVTGGAVQCWGANGAGQLGTGDTTGHATPVAVPGVSGASSVAAFGNTTCVVTSGGVRCWGDNASGQLGQGTASPAFSASPLAVTLPFTPTLVSVGGHHACAVTAGGLYCWGSDAELELGLAVQAASPSPPVQADKLDNRKETVVVATGDAHTCGARSPVTELTLTCSGRNDLGQAGTIAGNPVVEGTAGLNLHAVGASSGLDFTCALFDSAGVLQVACWGDNRAGQLGRTTTQGFDGAAVLIP